MNSLTLFGSYVRGEQTNRSNLDLLVEFSKAPGLLGLIELESYLSDILESKVDLVFKKALKPNMGESILSEAVSRMENKWQATGYLQAILYANTKVDEFTSGLVYSQFIEDDKTQLAVINRLLRCVLQNLPTIQFKKIPCL